MIDVIIDTLIDGFKLLPFLFVAFLIIEFIEHKLDSEKIVKKAGKFGPIVGSLLGAFPQCGFSVLGTNLYATRIITLGTLISIYLSTSDEMIPIMISQNIDIIIIIKILIFKVIVGMICGIIIDLLVKKTDKLEIEHCCKEEHCDCEHGIFKSALKHTLSILLFIIVVSFLINTYLYILGEESLSRLFLKNSIFSPFISSLVGLIPNCASSVAITELYLNNAISFGALLSGLLTGSGVGILVLFKTNKNLKENIKILLIIYFIGVISGIIVDLLGVVI